MGKFINTEVMDTYDSLSNTMKDLYKNQFQYLTEQTPTPTNYFNTILEHTHIGEDDPAGLHDSYIGNNSPFRYNLIEGLPICGLEKILYQLEMTEDGADLSAIEGEGVVYPNTIHPYPGDHFTIPSLKETFLFRVTEVQQGQADNGANYFKLSYVVVSGQNTIPDKQIMAHSKFIFNNIGSGLNTIVPVKSYDTVTLIDELLYKLRIYYKELFYSKAVQSLIFTHNDMRCYDMYLTEFIIRTGILVSQDDFTFFSQQLQASPTFNIKYEKTLFYCVETKNKRKLSKMITQIAANRIDDRSSIFHIRYDDYYSMMYDHTIITSTIQNYLVNSFLPDLAAHVEENKLYDNSFLDNLIIKYFNNTEVTDDDLELLDDIDFEDSEKLYYYIPVIIYILEYTAKTLMK